jgi:hypothetical protein
MPGELRATSAPTVSGTPQVGETLTGDAGDWTPTPDEVRYRWLLDGAVVPDVTTPTYTLTPEDAGKQVALKVAVLRDGFTKVVTRTSPQEVRRGTLVPTGEPVVTGSMSPGERLVATLPSVAPDATRSVQWMRDGAPIDGATARRYVLTTDDLGHRVRARVQWVKDGYTPLALLSATPPPVRTVPVVTAELETVGHRVFVHVRAQADGVERIGSMIAIRDERDRVLALKPLLDGGSVTVRLADQAAGKHTYRIISRMTDATRRAYVDRSVTVR